MSPSLEAGIELPEGGLVCSSGLGWVVLRAILSGSERLGRSTAAPARLRSIGA